MLDIIFIAAREVLLFLILRKEKPIPTGRFPWCQG
jgi:hypothetical protein